MKTCKTCVHNDGDHYLAMNQITGKLLLIDSREMDDEDRAIYKRRATCSDLKIGHGCACYEEQNNG